MKISRLQAAFLVSGDMDAQSSFYEQVLGLKLKFRDGDRWAQYDAGGTNIALASREEAQPATQGTVLVFEVEDFDGVAKQIEQHGGHYLGTRDMGSHGAVLSAQDPEGNIIQFFRRAGTEPLN